MRLSWNGNLSGWFKAKPSFLLISLILPLLYRFNMKNSSAKYKTRNCLHKSQFNLTFFAQNGQKEKNYTKGGKLYNTQKRSDDKM